MAIAFGLDVEDDDYDLTCSDIGKWPEPVEEYTNIYLDGECTTEGEGEAEVVTCDVEFVPHHTLYSAFVEGDYKRLVMDIQLTGGNFVTRREDNAFEGKYCIYWDNYEGWNPQPWEAGDCGIQALFLNDYYYDTYYACYYYES